MSQRKPGWYWVRIDEEWMTAYYGVMAWTWAYMPMDGCDELEIHEDEDVPFDKIGPRIPTPDEPWQCVPVEPTGEMVLAYARESGDAENAAFDWRTMLAAAPKPENS